MNVVFGAITLRVVLIEIAGLGLTFLAEREHEELSQASGVQGWILRKRLAVRDYLEKAETLLGRTLNGVWVKLQRLIAPDEHLLRQLRHVQSLAIDHPARITPAEVNSLWSNLMTRRFRTHRNWMLVDATLAVPAVLLALLPGPNLVGYWLVYRAMVHLLALLGARSGRTIAVKFVPHVELDLCVTSEDVERITQLAEHLEIPGFETLVNAYATPTAASR